MRALLLAAALLAAPVAASAQGINNPPAPTTGSGNWVRATSPTLTTPVLGAATGTSLALGGATLGSDALAVTGTSTFSGNMFPQADVRAAGNFRLSAGILYWTSSTELTVPANGAYRFRQTSGGQLTVSTLPACTLALTGMQAFVTDATVTVFAAAAVGSSTNHVPVYCDGGTTTWRVG